MKPNQLFRNSVTVIAILLSVLFLENKRKANNSAYRIKKEQSVEASNLRMSTTDFIFFESLSKYLFISLVK